VNESKGAITGVAGDLFVEGTFDDAQLAQLEEAAERCRITRALKVPVDVPVRQAPGDK
jgi:hypothetical protein